MPDDAAGPLDDAGLGRLRKLLEGRLPGEYAIVPPAALQALLARLDAAEAARDAAAGERDAWRNTSRAWQALCGPAQARAGELAAALRYLADLDECPVCGSFWKDGRHYVEGSAGSAACEFRPLMDAALAGEGPPSPRPRTP